MDIAVMADKGGVGKSTLAVHVATRLRQQGHDVGLLDLDRNATSSLWVAKQAVPYFAAYPLTELTELPEHTFRVWDTPAHPAVGMQQALLELCDVLVIVAMADESSQAAAANLYWSLDGRADGRVRVLFNGTQPNSREGADSQRAARDAGMSCFDTTVRRYNCYGHAQWDGRAVCDYPYASADKAWADIVAVVNEILAA